MQDCSSHSRIIHVFGTQGSFNARPTVTGADGKTIQQSTPVTVSAPNTPPTIPSLTPTTPPGSTNPLEVRFTWAVNDFDSDITRCRFDADSDGIWEFDNLCSGLPTTSGVGKASTITFSYDYRYKQPGRYTATLEAADPHVATQATVSVRVPYNRIPEISTFKATAGENLSISVDFSVSDPDRDALECTLTVESVGSFRFTNCSAGTRHFTFNQVGTYLITLTVKDTLGAHLNASKPVTFSGGDNGPIIATPSLISGEYHSCFLAATGKIYCWGDNGSGQLGDGTTISSSSPNWVPTELRFKSAVAGAFFVCGLTEAGEAYCWGDNNYNQLGDGTSNRGTSPQKVVGGLVFTQISAGYTSACGLTAAGDAYCWGAGGSGQLGQDDNLWPYSSSVPVQVQAGGVKYAQIAMGYTQVCALTAAGETYCWGQNCYGSGGVSAVGYVDNPNKNYDPGFFDFPQRVAQSNTFRSLAAGLHSTCGLESGGAAYCWGSNYFGNLGVSTDMVTDTDHPDPLAVTGSHTFTQLAAGSSGSSHICGIKDSGELRCWGKNDFGQLGVGDQSDSYTPQTVQGHAFAQVSLGSYQTCGYTLDEKLLCWGHNNYGQLGNGNTTDQLTPVQVNPLP